MSVEEFLRGKGGLGGTGARLAYEDRWMVFSGVANHWIVYQRRQGTQKTKVLFGGDPDGALEVLEQGLTKKNSKEPAAKVADTLVAQAVAIVDSLQTAPQATS